jgi:hypothetical protein
MSLGRILLAVAVAACLLGVGVLEVLSERAPREQVLPTFPKVGDLRSDDSQPWWESGEAVSGQALEATLAAPEGALTRGPESRPPTALDVDESLRSGDVVRTDPANGHDHPVVVLHHAWQQGEGEVER